MWGGNPECEHEWAETVDGAEGYTSRKRWQHGETRESNPEGWSREVRKYSWCRRCGAWRGALGLEPHPNLFINHLVEICREIRRVLKPSGTFFLNLGDTYYGGPYRGSETIGTHRKEVAPPFKGPPKNLRSNWLQPKQLLGLPWRVVVALQNDGWILRNAVVWAKPNPMPSSVKDRLATTYEFVFLLVKARRYWFDLDAIRVPQMESSLERYPINKRHKTSHKKINGGPKDRGDGFNKYIMSKGIQLDPRGKNPGDVWTIPTAPFPGAHFATFPPRLIEPIVKAGCPAQVCRRCGKPRTRITKPTENYKKYLDSIKGLPSGNLTEGYAYYKSKTKSTTAEYETVGWSDCGCNAGWEPGVVLDPFAGSGTVGQVARRLRRRFILIEIKPEYCEMAERRVRGQRRGPPEGVVPLEELFTSEEQA